MLVVLISVWVKVNVVGTLLTLKALKSLNWRSVCVRNTLTRSLKPLTCSYISMTASVRLVRIALVGLKFTSARCIHAALFF